MCPEANDVVFRPSRVSDEAAPLIAAVLDEALEEEGATGVLSRLCDPLWCQAVGCLLGLDYGESSVTIEVLEALRRGLEEEHGPAAVRLCVGKSPHLEAVTQELDRRCELLGQDAEPLKRASRLTARVDAELLLDGYDLYLQAIAFTDKGQWAVVQQGLSEETGRPRRYHWRGNRLLSYVNAPHKAISCDERKPVLDLTAPSSKASRETILELARQEPAIFAERLSRARDAKRLQRHRPLLRLLAPERLLPSQRLLFEARPQRFVELLEVEGVEPLTLRALALVAEIVEGAIPSRRDPTRHGFTLGRREEQAGAAERAHFDSTVGRLEQAVARSNVGTPARVESLRRLDAFHGALIEAQGAATTTPGAQRQITFVY